MRSMMSRWGVSTIYHDPYTLTIAVGNRYSREKAYHYKPATFHKGGNHFDQRWKKEKMKLIWREQSLGDLPFHIQQDILARLPMKVLVMFKCVSKTWSTLIGDPYSISSIEDSSSTPHNFMIPRLNQYHHPATRSSLSLNIDPIFPTMRELHLWKAPSAGKYKIVRCGSSVRISSPKLKLVMYGCMIRCGIPSAKSTMAEYCILKPIINSHETREDDREAKWVVTSKDILFFEEMLYQVIWIYMAICGVNEYTIGVTLGLGLDIMCKLLEGHEWWE